MEIQTTDEAAMAAVSAEATETPKGEAATATPAMDMDREAAVTEIQTAAHTEAVKEDLSEDHTATAAVLKAGTSEADVPKAEVSETEAIRREGVSETTREEGHSKEDLQETTRTDHSETRKADLSGIRKAGLSDRPAEEPSTETVKVYATTVSEAENLQEEALPQETQEKAQYASRLSSRIHINSTRLTSRT